MAANAVQGWLVGCSGARAVSIFGCWCSLKHLVWGWRGTHARASWEQPLTRMEQHDLHPAAEYFGSQHRVASMSVAFLQLSLEILWVSCSPES